MSASANTGYIKDSYTINLYIQTILGNQIVQQNIKPNNPTDTRYPDAYISKSSGNVFYLTHPMEMWDLDKIAVGLSDR